MALVTCRRFSGGTIEIPQEQIVERVSVYALIFKVINGDVCALLMRQTNGKYFFPGGGKEPYESFQVAGPREVKEETGYDVRLGRHFDFAESFYYIDERELPIHSTMLLSHAEIIGGELRTEGEQHKDGIARAHWVSLIGLSNKEFEDIQAYLLLQRAWQERIKMIQPCEKIK